jgi:transcriptional regulator with XRE-family HTH domain
MGKYARLFKEAATSVDFWTQVAIRDFVRELLARMDSLGMKRAGLASSIDTSPAYISKIMRGDANFTLESMTKLALAVGGRIRVQIVEHADSSYVVSKVIQRAGTFQPVIIRSESVLMALRDVEDAANEMRYVSVLKPNTTITSKAA